jgi:type IV pilus assembly protein PilC
MGAELPLPTKIVIWLSDMTRKYIIFILIGLGAAIYAIKRYYATDQGSGHRHLHAQGPVVGMLIRKVAVARFTRTLGTLISSGVPILEGLLITARAAAAAWSRGRHAGPPARHRRRHMAEPLKSTPVFPAMVVHMISVGENTGALDAMLNKLADFYDDEVDAAVGALTSLLEPMMIVFLGVSVGGIVIAMYLPIFKMVTLIK